MGQVADPLWAPAPNRLWVGDSYVPTWAGFVYLAFVVDVFSRRIVGWRAARSMTTSLVLDALEHALYTRAREGVSDLTGLVRQSDARSQYTSVALTRRLIDEGIDPSVGSVGDCLVSAMAETTVGSFKNEFIPGRACGATSTTSSRHRRMGRLVQHRATPRAPRRPHTRDRRETSLRSQTGHTRGRAIQQQKSPDTPGRSARLLKRGSGAGSVVPVR